MSEIIIRAIQEDDIDQVFKLNEAEVPKVNFIDEDEIYWYMEHASYFWVAVDGDRVAGLLSVLYPGIDYDSENYAYFTQHLPHFAYVDRIIVNPDYRGRGVGRALYEHLFKEAKEHTNRVTCEVNINPPNEDSITFHKRMGFYEVDTQWTEKGKKEVSLMVREI